MIKACFIDEQPGFLKVVKDAEGNKIATIHAQTKTDKIAITEAGQKQRIVSGGMEIDINSDAYVFERMWRCLNDHGAGWEIDVKLTKERLSMLDDDSYKAINKAILEHEHENLVTGGIEKN